MSGSIIPVPPGQVAAVVTHLEMRAARAGRAASSPGLSLKRITEPGLDWYRALFRAVGEEWLWNMRLALDDAALAAIIHDPKVEVYALSDETGETGLLELEFEYAEKGHCQLSYFGLAARAIGTGAGRWMMGRAVERVFSGEPPIQVFAVHTCTLDHPAALGFYLRSGFKAVKRELEIMPDPRLNGLLPAGAAGDVPVIPAP